MDNIQTDSPYPTLYETVSYLAQEASSSMKTIHFHNISCRVQNPFGKSNIAELVRDGKVENRNVGWCWINKGAQREWVCKWELVDHKLYIVWVSQWKQLDEIQQLPCEN